MKTLNYGIIGCGMMGQEHIRNIKLLENTCVAAIFEPDAAMRKRSAEYAPDVVFRDSIEALLAEDLDCLVIASPNFRHVEQLQEVARHRHLPILCEKPLATRAEDREAVQKFAAAYSAPVWVAMEYRYMPPLARFLEEVEAATGGVKMLTIREHRFPFLPKVNDWNRFNRYSGGTLVEKCCHFFDLMRLITRGEPTRVMASGWQAHNHMTESYGGETPDIWDAAFATVEFDNDVRALLDLCMFAEGSQYQEEISAIGPEGKVECLIPGPTRFWNKKNGPPPTPKVVISPRDLSGVRTIEVPVDPTLLTAGDHHGSTFYQHEQFRRVVLGERAPEVTLRDGWMAVEMGMAAQTASIEGRVIDIKGTDTHWAFAA
ncbi:MAG: Gfo/Idh/MocA family oxidoreductase [Pseudomonadota bacterium]